MILESYPGDRERLCEELKRTYGYQYNCNRWYTPNELAEMKEINK
jgi:hypothetical protein